MVFSIAYGTFVALTWDSFWPTAGTECAASRRRSAATAAAPFVVPVRCWRTTRCSSPRDCAPRPGGSGSGPSRTCDRPRQC